MNVQRVFNREQKKAVNLHQAWDTLILRDAMKGTRVADHAEKLAEGISEEQAKEWAKGNAQAWAGEGRTVAVRVAYLRVSRMQRRS